MHTCTKRLTFPLLTFSEQARIYMGIPMTTSIQAWTAPALHSDMHVVRVNSACWRRSSCSSPSDRLCCVRLSESGLVRRSYGVAYRRGSRVRGISGKLKKMKTFTTSLFFLRINYDHIRPLEGARIFYWR